MLYIAPFSTFENERMEETYLYIGHGMGRMRFYFILSVMLPEIKCNTNSVSLNISSNNVIVQISHLLENNNEI